MSYVHTKVKGWLVATVLAAMVAPVYAQQPKDSDGVGDEQVVVTKAYEINIQDAQKQNIQPNVPEIEEKPKVLNYNIPTKDIKDFTFEPNPLKPIALGAEKLEKYNSSYIKVGFGSQIMPIAQLAYNDNKTKNLKFGIHYNHLSAMDYKIKPKRFSDDQAGLYVRYYPKKFEVGMAFNFQNLRTHFFGTDSTEKNKDIRQVYRNYEGTVYFGNGQKNKADIDYKQSVTFNYLTEKFGKTNEWYIAGNTDFRKGIKKQHAALANIQFDVSRLTRDTSKLNRTIITIAGGYAFNNDDWRAHGIFGLTMFGQKPFLYADLHVEKRLYEHSIIAYIDYTHKLRKNSLNSYAHVNNWVENSLDVRNSLVGDLGIGFKGTLQNFSYNVAFHFNHIKQNPFFVNDTMDMKRFLVVYDSNTLVYNAHFEAGYNVKEWLRFTLVGDYNHYQLKNQARAWSEPAFRTTFRANYIWKKKISVYLDLYGVTSTYAPLAVVDGSEIKLKGTADINVGIEYFFNKHVSFWGMINNIANQNYGRFYKYTSYGINGAIGAKFAF